MPTDRLPTVRVTSEQVWTCLGSLYSEVQVEHGRGVRAPSMEPLPMMWADRQTHTTENINFATPLAGSNDTVQIFSKSGSRKCFLISYKTDGRAYGPLDSHFKIGNQSKLTYLRNICSILSGLLFRKLIYSDKLL